MTRWWIVLALGIAIVGGVVLLFIVPAPATAPAPNNKVNLIRVEAPIPNFVIHSPLFVFGEARGYWFFEASFPVEIRDSNGVVLGVGIAQAQEEWMTEEFVPFKATIPFASSTIREGVVVFKKDNPSGLPEHDDEYVVPVKFLES